MITRHIKSIFATTAFLKVQLGDIVTDMRVKSGGMVYQRGRYGLIKRTKVSPVNPQSTEQQTQRGTFSGNSSAWRDLTEAERNSWIAGAADFPYSDIFGNRQVLSGNSLFVKLNTVLVNLGQSALSSCPSAIAVDPVLISSLAGDESAHTLALAFTDTPIPAGFKLVVEATPQLSAGVNFFKNKYKILARVDAGGTSPQALGTAYEAMFGTLTAGKKIAVRAYLASKTTGQVGIATAESTIVVA